MFFLDLQPSYLDLRLVDRDLRLSCFCGTKLRLGHYFGLAGLMT